VKYFLILGLLKMNVLVRFYKEKTKEGIARVPRSGISCSRYTLGGVFPRAIIRNLSIAPFLNAFYFNKKREKTEAQLAS